MFDPLTEHRREFVAKTIMDVVKFVSGAGAVSGFFATLPAPARIALGIGLLVFFVFAWVLFPPKGGR